MANLDGCGRKPFGCIARFYPKRGIGYRGGNEMEYVGAATLELEA
jgi:hypothetical protein